MRRELRIARAQARLEHCEATIREMRPHQTWDEVLRVVNIAHPDTPITMGQMMRSVKSLVDAGVLPDELLGRVKRD